MRQPWKHLTAFGLAALFALSIAVPTTHAATSSSGWLGVYTQSLNEGLRSGIGYSGDGVLVSGVESDSPADKAGIHKGDVITAYNSRTVNSPSALTDAVTSGKPGQSVSLGVWRDGARRSVTVKLGERPSDLDTPEPGNMSWDNDDDGPTPPTPPSAPRSPEAYWMDRGMEMKAFGAAMDGMRPRLGVSVQDLNKELGDYFGVSDGKGILVTAVTEDTPASKAGFKAGDVIVKVGDRSVEDSGDLRAALRERPAGKVDVTVMRKGQRTTLTPELAERPKNVWYSAPGDMHMRHTGPGTWSYMGPNGEKRIYIHRTNDDGDVHIVTPDGSHHVIVGDGDDDSKDQAEMQKQIDALKQEIDALKGQIQSSKTTTKSSTSKSTTTKKTP